MMKVENGEFFRRMSVFGMIEDKGSIFGIFNLIITIIIIIFIFISFNFTKRKSTSFVINKIYSFFSVRFLYKLYNVVILVIFAEWKVRFVFGRIDTKTQ